MGVTKDLLHGFTSPFCITFFDGAGSGSVVGDIFFEPASDAIDGDYKYRAQNRVDRSAKALQHRIVRGVKNGEVKRLVCSRCGSLIIRRFHRCQRRIDALPVLLGGARRSQRGSSGLND